MVDARCSPYSPASTVLSRVPVDQTNKYAVECMGTAKFEMWDKVTVDELCLYMGFMLDNPSATIGRTMKCTTMHQ